MENVLTPQKLLDLYQELRGSNKIDITMCDTEASVFFTNVSQNLNTENLDEFIDNEFWVKKEEYPQDKRNEVVENFTKAVKKLIYNKDFCEYLK